MDSYYDEIFAVLPTNVLSVLYVFIAHRYTHLSPLENLTTLIVCTIKK